MLGSSFKYVLSMHTLPAPQPAKGRAPCRRTDVEGRDNIDCILWAYGEG